MKSFLEIFLGILTAMGGFVEIGELVFSVNAGVKFRYSLLWMEVLGTVGIIVFSEMSGRVAAVTGLSVFSIIRQRAGYGAGLMTLLAANAVSLLTCTAEIGGLALLLKLLFGGNYFVLAATILVGLLAEGFLIDGFVFVLFVGVGADAAECGHDEDHADGEEARGLFGEHADKLLDRSGEK